MRIKRQELEDAEEMARKRRELNELDLQQLELQMEEE